MAQHLSLSSHVIHTEERVTITTRSLPRDGDEYDDTDERDGLLGQHAVAGRGDDDSSGEGSSRSFFMVLRDVSIEHLPSFNEGSIRGSVFNLASATLGAGALSVPYAFQVYILKSSLYSDFV
jgi:hypothetical protein